MNRVDACTLRPWIEDAHELAILDAREEGEFGAGHLFWAVPCPLSRCEIRARALLPRLTTRVVCVDDNRGVAGKLAAYLGSIGCTDLTVLEGGTPAWARAGYEVFTGANVLSRAFGGWVELHYGTDSIEAPALKAWLDTRRDVMVFDTRAHEEFVRMSIPGAVNVPGGELAYRIADLAPEAGTTLVVHSAGRTRGILGAESLRRIGLPNRVFTLHNGLMGWELAGLRCERGRTGHSPLGVPKTLPIALERAARFAEASGVGVIGPIDLTRFEEDPDRTCYVLDVREPAEFKTGHRPGSRNAPGGQLLSATDQWIGVRGARIVLLDDTGVRARIAAAWLRQMGHRDVFVVEGGLDEVRTAGPGAIPVPELANAVPMIGVPELTALLDAGDRTIVVDVSRSIDYRQGHIPGALWGVRTRLATLAPQLATAKHLVATSPDGSLARLAVPELQALTQAEVRALEGGNQVWHAFGRPLIKDKSTPPDEACIDVQLRPHDRDSGVEQAMRAYLAWEMGLLDQIERDGTVQFGVATELA
ncbi:MAG: thiosulfate sulfurtransferase [Acetobacteraceae bacterium]|nr:thiosulfate sulfurtransferase [Acetobacteraceae bacterium]